VPRQPLQAFRQTPDAKVSTKSGPGRWPLSKWWSGTEIVVPAAAPRVWIHGLTGDTLQLRERADGARVLPVDSVLQLFPVALLYGDCH
jgi:hypothetical protein